MAKVIVELEQMSIAEATAWIDAIAEKYGTDLVFECLKIREHRYEVMDGSADVALDANR